MLAPLVRALTAVASAAPPVPDAVRCRTLWLGGWYGFVEQQGHFPDMREANSRTVLVPLVAGAPTVDGSLADPAWAVATRLYSPVRSAPGASAPEVVPT
jgi:hypothetical protein